jgi:hypothetical protein
MTRSVSHGEPPKNGRFGSVRALLEVSSFPSLSFPPTLSSLSSIFGSTASSDIALASIRKFATALALHSSVGNPSLALSLGYLDSSQTPSGGDAFRSAPTHKKNVASAHAAYAP